MKGLIVSSGDINDYQLLANIIKKYDYVVCADGGIRHLKNLGYIPDLVVGDVDSTKRLDLTYIEENSIKIKKFPTVKDSTDTELSLYHLIEVGFKAIDLIGVTGSRLDHTFANLLLLRILTRNNITGKIINDTNQVYHIKDFIKLEKKDYSYVSIIPLNHDGVLVSLNGFFYSGAKQLIPYGTTLGVSNKLIEDEGYIKVHKGEALIIESKD